MPTFVWTGKTRAGATQSGEIQGASRGAVMVQLRRQQVTISSIKEKPKEIQLKFPGRGGGKVTEKDLVIFTRQFCTMLEAGIPMVQCLGILAGQAENPAFAKIIGTVKADVEEGASFAEALGKHPKVFDDLFVNMVTAGEIGGILDTIMGRLAAYMEKAQSLKHKVKSAMVYPGVIFVVANAVVIFLLVFIIPMFAAMFADFGGQLPPLTAFVIGVSNLVKGYFYLLIPIPIVALVALKRYYGTEPGHLQIDHLLLKAPVFGPLIQKIAMARFTRTLGTLVASGVPIIEALTITAKTAGNKVVEGAVLVGINSVKEGQTIASPLAKSPVFPTMAVKMIEVGEASGELDAMLSKIADFYDDEVDAAVSALTSLLEPLLMIFLGVVIGFVVIAMYLPIFKLASVVGGD